MDRDEKISFILSGIGVLWMFGGLALLAWASWTLRSLGIVALWLEVGLAVFYLATLAILGGLVMFFWARSAIRSGGRWAIFLPILSIILSLLLGQAIWRMRLR